LFGGIQWQCMYSGLPTEFEELRRRLAATECPKTLEGVTEAVEHAYDELTKHLIERRILAPLGLTRDVFMTEGLEMFGDTYFRELLEQCRAVKPETDLLVMGFDEKSVPHLFQAYRDGTCTNYDQLGFYAIGAGAWAALGSLYASDVRSARSTNRVVYRLCEAKFLSEIARSVGGLMTVVNVFYADGSDYSLFINDEDPIRIAWKKQRSAPIPQEAIDEIDQFDQIRLQDIDRRRKAYLERSKPS
jgi:hypothetical protein